MTATALVARAVGRVVGRRRRLGPRVRRGRRSSCALVGGRDAVRRWLLLVLVARLGLPARLAHPPPGRRGHGEDPRYEALLGGPVARSASRVAVRKVFLVQGVAIWFVSLPVQVGGALGGALRGPWSSAGVLRVAGRRWSSSRSATPSSRRTRRDPDRGPVMDRGLWALDPAPELLRRRLRVVGHLARRRPRLRLAARPADRAAPVAMTYFLVFATGARLLERTMMQRPGYPEYAARTSMFFPLPPRSRLSARSRLTGARRRLRRAERSSSTPEPAGALFARLGRQLPRRGRSRRGLPHVDGRRVRHGLLLPLRRAAADHDEHPRRSPAWA